MESAGQIQIPAKDLFHTTNLIFQQSLDSVVNISHLDKKKTLVWKFNMKNSVITVSDNKLIDSSLASHK